MHKIIKQPLKNLGYDFIPSEFIPVGKDEYHIREKQRKDDLEYRALTANEVEVLVKNNNQSDDWNKILVTDRFNPHLVKGCQFHGLVRIGDLDNCYLEFHDLQLRVGLTNSTIISCDIGSNVVIENVRYLAHYIIGDEVILLNVNEMLATNYAKFGNGIVKEGEPEDVRVWVEVGNENGGRRILPFDGILPGDAWLWSKYRDDAELMDRFKEMTDQQFDRQRGHYGEVGSGTIVKYCKILKDVNIGPAAYIKGANKLKNLTINSSVEAPTQIGEGVELVNGIIGHGCRIFYGVKAVRFVIGSFSNLKYGARLINSMISDNTTISCCEVLNALIFPSHEQHHNNSFLCAAVVYGQSNIAAGVTIGSNHNSRGNDGEIVAGRGFWPGLCASLKHNSKFASFVLIAKGSYQSELNIPIPFSLVSNDESQGVLQVMPAYWFMYNMYAIARNSWKFNARDNRIKKEQDLEFDYLAPDTIEEIFWTLELLEIWTGTAWYRNNMVDASLPSPEERRKKGIELLKNHPEVVKKLEIIGEKMECSKRKVIILKTVEAWHCYREMINFYGVKNLVFYMLEHKFHLGQLKEKFNNPERQQWVNLGGQLTTVERLGQLRDELVDGIIDSWGALHIEYSKLAAYYKKAKINHALASLLEINGLTLDTLTEADWAGLLEQAKATYAKIAKETAISREKDYSCEYRKITYDTNQEMESVIGTIDDNDFIRQIREESLRFNQNIDDLNDLKG